MSATLQSISSFIGALAGAEGENKTPIPYLTAHTYPDRSAILIAGQNPFAYLVVQGSARITFPDSTSEIRPGEYFLSSDVRTAPTHITALSSDRPHLGLRIDLTAEDVASVMLDMEMTFTDALFERPTDRKPKENDHKALLSTVLRALKVDQTQPGAAFLMKHLKRELVFNLIDGPYGNQFVRIILNVQNAKDIYSINDWIKNNFAAPLSVNDLAGLANMSPSSLHKKFKAAIGMGPLQCQKQLRLAEARRLMLDENASVTSAAFDVGYESLSQFSREYKKMFSRSPQKDIQDIRARKRGA